MVEATGRWRRLSHRDEGIPVEPEVPYEGVPSHLLPDCQAYLLPYLDSDPFRAHLRRSWRLRAAEADKKSLYTATLRNPKGFVLDLLDFALDSDQGTLAALHGLPNLESALYGAGSAWRVKDDSTGLERRVEPKAVAARDQALAAAPNASDHLATAWSETYGLHPNPGHAYSEAIKAVEAAAVPLVEPNNAHATLGTVLRTLRDQQATWTVPLTNNRGEALGTGSVLALMELLWGGQSDRHGGAGPTRPVGQEAAEVAVHAAVTLVQWFGSGAVRRNLPES